VRTYSSPRQIPRPTGAQIVGSARAFLGVRYLWGGTSAFGFDCSGLIELAFRANGVVIPRDADAQALEGGRVARTNLRAGDLIFYGRAHVHHSALYAGGGRMIEAPNSASSVRLAPVRSSDWAGARRYTG
jgi:cell wall-associated NlpC family hydrolase